MIVISIHNPGRIEPPSQACFLPSAKIKFAFVQINEGTSAVEMAIERLIVKQKRHKNMYNRSMVLSFPAGQFFLFPVIFARLQ